MGYLLIYMFGFGFDVAKFGYLGRILILSFVFFGTYVKSSTFLIFGAFEAFWGF